MVAASNEVPNLLIIGPHSTGVGSVASYDGDRKTR